MFEFVNSKSTITTLHVSADGETGRSSRVGSQAGGGTGRSSRVGSEGLDERKRDDEELSARVAKLLQVGRP